ncbi:MAG: DUF1854 domain-containing protein [Burkholderiales bacterium]
MTSTIDFSLQRDALGRLVLTTAQGERFEGVVPVRAFPIASPQTCLSLVSAEGHEVAWIDRLDDLPSALRGLLEEELASREFVPEIRRLKSVSSFATPSTWDIETNRGETQLVLKGEEDIRRLGRNSLLVADRHGIQFLIRDLRALDRASRRLLDRFL